MTQRKDDGEHWGDAAGSFALWVVTMVLIVATWIGTISLGLFFVGCGSAPLIPEGPRAHDRDLDACGAACVTLEKYACDGYQGSPGSDEQYGTADDVDCAQTCRDILSADRTVTLNTGCVSRATGCEAVDVCFTEGD